MEKKLRETKIFCIGDSLVFINPESKAIPIPFSISEEKLKQEIDCIIKETDKRPTEVFRDAIERITGIKMYPTFYKFKKNGKNFGLQDSQFYQTYSAYICKKRNYAEKQQEMKEKRKIEEGMRKYVNYCGYRNVCNFISNFKRNHK